MFSVMSVVLLEGVGGGIPHVTITHDALETHHTRTIPPPPAPDLTVQGTSPRP